MAILNYVIGKENNKITLLNDKIDVIDSVTSKYENQSTLANNIKFSEQIGMYLYDNDGDFTDEEIENANLELEYLPQKEDIDILQEVLKINNQNRIQLNIMYLNEALKVNNEVIKMAILKRTPHLKKYLQELEESKKYYLYMRIIDSYYNNKESKLTSAKKLVLK